MEARHSSNWIIPDWPLPPHVKACVTTCRGGVSQGGFSGLNLARHVGDEPDRVMTNRHLLNSHLPAAPCWLNQVHGVNVATYPFSDVPEADAVIARDANQICAVLTADCLPVLFCAEVGQAVAAAHAGWRGLAAGVLEATLAEMAVRPETVSAWLGPAISQKAFEVGEEVREVFLSGCLADEAAFIPSKNPGKWMADLYALARARLKRAGVGSVYGGAYCTYQQSELFFSFRREPVCGRFASLIWIEHA